MPLMRALFSCLLLLALAGPSASAENIAARVKLVQGAVSAGQPGQVPRIVTVGDPLLESDIINVGDRAFAIVEFADGGQASLRPGSVVAIERFRHTASDESEVLKLLKGGLRMVSGLIAKRHPDRATIQTSTATIGIRGTNFDARLCKHDCADEERRLAAAGRQSQYESAVPIAARVVQLEAGSKSTAIRGNASIVLHEGSALFAGDRIETGPGFAVIAFSDGTRISVRRDSRFLIEDYSLAQPARPDALALRLLRGGLRAVSGLIGKQHPESVSYKTSTATIGIRGTLVDMSCEGPCAGVTGGKPAKRPGEHDGLFVLVWEGKVVVGEAELAPGELGFIGQDGQFRRLAEIPGFLKIQAAPRPDSIKIDLQRLFGKTHLDGVPPGLYVFMREGVTLLTQSSEEIFLTPYEAGYAGDGATPIRLDTVPLFLQFDDIPLPDQADEVHPRLIELVTEEGIPAKDRDICEIR